MWITGLGRQNAAKLLPLLRQGGAASSGEEPNAHQGPPERGTGRGPRQPEANHRKPHHGHIVGEGCLLRTKDPLLD